MLQFPYQNQNICYFLLINLLNKKMNTINKMNFLIIDGAKDRINFFSFYNNNSYHKSFTVSKDNNEKFSILLFNFLNNNNINLSKLNNILVNQGPGKFSVIRTSIAVAKALSLTNQLNLYGFSCFNLVIPSVIAVSFSFNL